MNASGYLRSRRTAYVIAGIVLLLLGLWIFAGRVPDAYSRPILLPAGGQWHVVHDAHRGEHEDVVGIAVTVDPATLKPASRRELYGGATAAALRGGAPVVFYGRRMAALDAPGSIELPWPWTVQTAAGVEGDIWAAGIDAPPTPGSKPTIRAGRIAPDGPRSDESVAVPAGAIEQISMTAGPAGPTIAWREGNATSIRVARRANAEWTDIGTIEIGPAVRWTTVEAGPRLLAISFCREDRAWGSATFRIACCAGCRLPPPPNRWTFRDPLLFGRFLTGIAAAPDGNRLLLCLTRTSTIQFTALPLDSLTPPSDARLALLAGGIPWGQMVVMIWLCLMLTLAIALIYLGAVLIRERRRFLLAALGASAPAGPRPAGVFARAMAFLIDTMILMPVHLFLSESLQFEALGPETPLPQAAQTLGILAAIQFAYFFTLEAIFGRTAGKRLIGLRIESASGGRASIVQIFVRNLIRLLEVYPLFGMIAVTSVVFTRRHQRLGDLAARTVVLHDDPGLQPDDPAAVTFRALLERAVRRQKDKEKSGHP